MTDALTELLEAWCAAIDEADHADDRSPERANAEDIAQQLNLEIRARVLRLTGHRDQLAGAIDASVDRLASSRETLDWAWIARAGAFNDVEPTRARRHRR